VGRSGVEFQLLATCVGGSWVSGALVILGATSKIAFEIARVAARERRKLVLVGRNADRLDAVAGDLAARGAAHVEVIAAPLEDIARHAEFWDRIERAAGQIDEVLIAYGSLSDQARSESDAAYLQHEFLVNFNSPASLMNHAATYFETLAQKATGSRPKGVLAVITSVAGDRARRSNFTYGTAKGALSLFAQGTRSRLFSAGVRVLTIKPGPVATPMTAALPRASRMASPQVVAARIYRAVTSGRVEVLYVPGYWRLIMRIVREIPERIAKKLKF